MRFSRSSVASLIEPSSFLAALPGFGLNICARGICTRRVVGVAEQRADEVEEVELLPGLEVIPATRCAPAFHYSNAEWSCFKASTYSTRGYMNSVYSDHTNT